MRRLDDGAMLALQGLGLGMGLIIGLLVVAVVVLWFDRPPQGSGLEAPPTGKESGLQESGLQAPPTGTARHDYGDGALSHGVILEFVLRSEGGLNVNEPKRVGGRSYAGITQQDWMEWRRMQADMDHLPGDVARLAGGNSDKGPLADKDARLDLVKRFYYSYYARYHCWAVPEFLQLIFTDFSTIAGHRALELLQGILGVGVDGIWGTGTDFAVAQLAREIKDNSRRGWQVFGEFDKRKRAYFEGLVRRDPGQYAGVYAGWIARSDAVVGMQERLFRE